ncbi:head-tail joining protein [Pseudoalteromonas luteoviolacea CPMOR-1]|uniref:Head-tail joining protein n=1 Tax=Pseudoalteromonas luteoviolacea CPMOR-1 TaxID=1365248 RepID=A0A167H509_9GAMM|nr:gpW family head-tail joining protein [Pseudoalteromonas luteoviolacea]KZN57641.1 head-tail joining protein [Pseudoalteromonas luteoviolacea CPMOR-1]
MNIDQLKANLIEAQQAYHDLLTGQAVVSFVRSGRETRFTQANKADLKNYIDELETLINGTSKRRRGPARLSL